MNIPHVLRAVTIAVGVGALSVTASAVASSSGSDKHGGGNLLRSGVAASLSSEGPTLFGVDPGGAPWVIDEGRVRVRNDGRVKIRVEGLVIPSATGNGTNPLDWLGASVFCGGDLVATTTPVEYSDAGDARIREDVDLPGDCLAPVVLLHPASEKTVNTLVYIAASGS